VERIVAIVMAPSIKCGLLSAAITARERRIIEA
jgi:hypothetical protein